MRYVAGIGREEVHLERTTRFAWLALWGCGTAANISGCDQNQPRPDVFTRDIRIDGASEQNDPDSTAAKMCVNNRGEVYVVWLDNRADRNSDKQDIWMNRALTQPWEQNEQGEGVSWLAAPIRVNQGDGNVFAPSLYCNDLGAFVTWEDDRDGELENHQIYFNRTTDGGESFMAEDVLLEPNDEDGLSMSLGPRITGTGQDLFVTWYDGLNGAYDILVASSGDAGLTWRDPSRVDSDNAGFSYSGVPRIAVSENATNVWVVWEDARDGASDVYLNRSDSGGVTFIGDQRIDEGDEEGEFDSFSPQICADDYVYVVWHDARNGDGRDIYMNYSADGGENWGVAAQRLDADQAGLGNSVDPVCVAQGTTLHVAWQDNGEDNSGYDILYRKVVDGLPSAAPVRLDTGSPAGSANSLQPRIALEPTTHQHLGVMWRDGRAEAQGAQQNGYEDLYYNFSTNSGPFQPEGTAEGQGDLRVDSYYDGSSFKRDHNFAILGGRWYAVWVDGRSGTSDVFFQAFEIGNEATPPSLSDLENQ